MNYKIQHWALPLYYKFIKSQSDVNENYKQLYEQVLKIKGLTELPMYDFIMYIGGRGSGKSFSIADALIFISSKVKIFTVCVRETLESLEHSVYRDLKNRACDNGLDGDFKFHKDRIVHKFTGSEFIFKGLRDDPSKIKSLSGADICWVEEADAITHEVWCELYPTIRKPNATIIMSLNPKFETDALYEYFIKNIDYWNSGESKSKALIERVNWRDNVFWTEKLDALRLDALRVNPETYNWIWEGELLECSEAIIYKDKWIINDFEEKKDANFYYGLDFGFSIDPTAAVRCYIDDNKLFITHEAGGKNIDVLKVDDFKFNIQSKIPGFAKYSSNVVYADCAYPSIINHLKDNGFNVKPCKKWTTQMIDTAVGEGSVYDGIAYIRNFDKIIVHPRCEQTINEFRKYMYEIDKRSGKPKTTIKKGNDHFMDALRYALTDCILNKEFKFEAFNAISNVEVFL